MCVGRYFRVSSVKAINLSDCSNLCSTAHCEPKRVSEGAFEGHPHLSPQSREAAAERVGVLSALSYLYWLYSLLTSYSLAVKLVWRKLA